MNGSIQRRVFLCASLAALLYAPAVAAPPISASEKQPVLVELFTSEGCSSCPPADRVAIGLQSEPDLDVIILGEHVDYWNYLGWRDQYSSSQFSNRQHDFARSLGQQSVYTPQVVVDGRYGMNGSQREAIRSAVKKASQSTKATLNITAQTSGKNPSSKLITIRTSCPSSLGSIRAHLFVAVTENNLKSSVRSGENGGSVLEHTGVVRCLRKVGEVVITDERKPFSLTVDLELDPKWRKPNLRIVAFLQDASTMVIRGANQIKVD
jgi:hypothetical protein